MTEPRKLRVFLCHASQDKPIVRELYQRLLAEEWIDPWLDEEKLLPGQDWDMEIEKAVKNSDAIIVFLSGTSVSKEGYVQKEIKVALNVALYKPEGTIFIVPVRLDNCAIPKNLKQIQYIDYFPDSQKNRSRDRLYQALRLRYNEIIQREIIESKKKENEKQALIAVKEEKEQDSGLVSYELNTPAIQKPDNRFTSFTGNKNEISTKAFKTYGLIEIYGRVDSSNTTQFAKAFETLLDSGTFKILIDMTNLVYISSGGFRILLSAQRTCKRYGRGEIILAGVPNRIKEALELANFTDLFRVFDDIREASGSF